jgi:site-specific recombinase XerD
MNAYLKEIADICGITKKLSTHVCRRTMATTVLLNNGVPIEIISKVLGHLKISTTQVYAKVKDVAVRREINRVADMMNK